jgi:hypothetical protein
MSGRDVEGFQPWSDACLCWKGFYAGYIFSIDMDALQAKTSDIK